MVPARMKGRYVSVAVMERQPPGLDRASVRANRSSLFARERKMKKMAKAAFVFVVLVMMVLGTSAMYNWSPEVPEGSGGGIAPLALTR